MARGKAIMEETFWFNITPACVREPGVVEYPGQPRHEVNEWFSNRGAAMPASAAIEETVFLHSLPENDGRRVLHGGTILVERKLTEGKLSESYLGTHAGLDVP